MPRYRLLLEYDGAGSAAGSGRRRPRVAGGRRGGGARPAPARRATVVAAGRTDAGVHALGQVAHLDLAKALAARAARRRHQRPPAPAAGGVVEAAADAPTTSTPGSRPGAGATSIASSTAVRRRRSSGTGSGTCRCRSTSTHMHEAAQALVGRHDFTSFRARECQAARAGEDARPHPCPPSGRADRGAAGRPARSCTTRCATSSAR